MRTRQPGAIVLTLAALGALVTLIVLEFRGGSGSAPPTGITVVEAADADVAGSVPAGGSAGGFTPVAPSAPSAPAVLVPGAALGAAEGLLTVTLPGAVAARFTGRVVDLAGRPLADARVVCLPADATRAALGADACRWTDFQPPAVFGHAVTDADGRFVLDDQHVPSSPRPADSREWDGNPDPQLAVRLPGYAIRQQRCIGFRGGAFDVGTLVLEPELVVAGRTVDAQGLPVAGIPVTVQSWWARTESARDAGFEAGDAFTGALTRGDGRFEIHGVWPGRTFIRFGDFRDAIGGPDTDAGRLDLGDLTVAVEPRRAFRGIVVDAVGRPVAGAEVIALEDQVTSMPLGMIHGIDDALDLLRTSGQRTTTDADGRFTLPVTRDTAHQIHLLPRAHARARVRDVHPDQEDLLFEVRELGSWTLHLADAPGATTVRAFGHESQPDLGKQLERVTTTGLATPADDSDLRDAGRPLQVNRPDSAGDTQTWGIAAASPVQTCVAVQAPGRATELRVLHGVPPGQAPEMALALVAECRASGVVRSTSGAPLAAARLEVSPADAHLAQHFRWSVTAAADGSFDITGLGPGTWTLTASAPGHGTSAPRSLEFGTAGQVLAADFVLAPGASVRGRVLRADGSAARGESVLLSRVAESTPEGEPLLSVRAHAGGAFAFEELLPGSYALSASPGAEARVELGVGARAEVVLRLRTWPIVRGRILAGGEPVEGAEVYPFFGAGGAWVRMTTGPTGEYELELLGPGLYEVCACPPHGRRTGFDEFMVQADWEQVVEFDVELGSGRVGGTVVDAGSGVPLPDIGVRLEGDGDHSFSGGTFTARTDERGRFAFRPLSDGRYTVSARGGAYREGPPVRVDVHDGSAAEVRLELEAGLAGVRVLVTDPAGCAPRSKQFCVRAAPAGEDGANPGAGWLANERSGGLHVLEGLAPGAFTVTLFDTGARAADSADDRPLQQQTIELAAGELRELRLAVGGA